MALAFRIAIYVTTVFIAVALIVSAMNSSSFDAKIAELERDKINEVSSRLVSLITHQQTELLSKLSDWALWDDLYYFAKDRNQKFHRSNFTADSMRTLHINFLGVLDLSGKPIHQAYLPPDEQDRIEFPPKLMEFIQGQLPLLTRDGAAWITSFDGQMVVIAARPIQSNDGSGPVHGTITMGYIVTPKVAGVWSDILGVKMAYSGIDAKPEELQITARDEDNLSIQDVIFDHHMKPVVAFKYKIPRTTLKTVLKFETTKQITRGIILTIGILSLILILHFTVIRRLHFLETEMQEAFRSSDKLVSSRRDRPALIPLISAKKLTGLDELDRLALTFNELLVRDRESQVQKQNQELRLIEASKLTALGEMAGGIAHEINNPLAIIMARASILKSKVKDKRPEEEIQKDLQTIENTTVRISKIVAGLRTFARDSTHEAPTLNSVRRIVEESVALCSEKMRNSGVEVQLRIAHDEELEVRPVQISQVLLNLIGNAFDAIDVIESKWIRIEGQRINDRYILRVVDSGSGIPPEVAKKIMNPFFTTKDVGRGTGLGLSISQSIIQDHQGSLTLDQRAQNTTFEINIPLRQKPADSNQKDFNTPKAS